MAARTAIVTGASQGIGRATAIKLADSFSSLVLVARKEKELQQTAELISTSKKSVKILVLATDLSQRDAPDYVVSRTLEKFGKIHAVVNIAGAVQQSDPFKMTDKEWDGMNSGTQTS
jgi:3-oxoacyl-[acyl-carrier protein] reductase